MDLKKEGRKEGRKEATKEGSKEGRREERRDKGKDGGRIRVGREIRIEGEKDSKHHWTSSGLVRYWRSSITDITKISQSTHLACAHFCPIPH